MERIQYFIKNCTLIPTFGKDNPSAEDGYEISGGNPTITYFESLKSPSISLTISFIFFAFASILFSISSLTIEAGLWITSPAAIWFATDLGSWVIMLISTFGYFFI